MTTIVKSIFLDTVPPQEKEPLPTHIVKRFKIEGKIKDVVVPRRSK